MANRMAVSRKDLFAEKDVRLADGARALSHPARVAILRMLAEQAVCVCGEIVDEIPLAQSTVSQHLKAMKQAGLIEGTIDGPRSCYCLNVPALKQLAGDLADLFDAMERRACC